MQYFGSCHFPPLTPPPIVLISVSIQGIVGERTAADRRGCPLFPECPRTKENLKHSGGGGHQKVTHMNRVTPQNVLPVE